MIRSISYSQHEILSWISTLYLPGDTFDLDPCYGLGSFYRLGIPRPKHCYDISPRLPEVKQCDLRALPFNDQTLQSIILDPPFLAGGGTENVMTKRYGYLKSPADVWKLYRQGIIECSRVLKRQGILVVKCQDFLYGRNQYMTHIEVANIALETGLYPKDIFIFCVRSRPKAWNYKRQNHARKFHSYFWVFGKQKRSIGYSRDPRNGQRNLSLQGDPEPYNRRS